MVKTSLSVFLLFQCGISSLVFGEAMERERLTQTNNLWSNSLRKTMTQATCPSSVSGFSPLAAEPNADELRIDFYYYYYTKDNLDGSYYLYYDDELRDDDWGRAGHGADIGNLPGFSNSGIRVEENGVIHFDQYPWSCEETDCVGPATLRFFPEVDNNLKAGDKVYIKDTSSDDVSSFLVSWEDVQFKDGRGLINVQVEFFDNGSILLCCGEGDLAGSSTGLELNIGEEGDSAIGVKSFQNVEAIATDVWPEGQCFCYSPGEESFASVDVVPVTAVPTVPTTETCPLNFEGFVPLAAEPNADELKIDFYYDYYTIDNPDGSYYLYYDDELRDDDWGRAGHGADIGNLPGFTQGDVQVEEDGVVRIAQYPWSCEETDCVGPAFLRLFPEVDNNLKAGDKVYIKDTSSDDVSSFLVSWEDVQFKDGSGLINVQAKFYDNGSIQLCYGEGDLAGSSTGLEMSLGRGKSIENFHLPEGTASDIWPEGQCFCYSPKLTSFVPLSDSLSPTSGDEDIGGVSPQGGDEDIGGVSMNTETTSSAQSRGSMVAFFSAVLGGLFLFVI